MVLHEWPHLGGMYHTNCFVVVSANMEQFGSLITYGLASIDSSMRPYQVCLT